MVKRSLAMLLSLILLTALLSVSVIAAPYKELKVGSGETVIEAIWFDSADYFETTPSDGNHDIRVDEEVQTYDYTINDDYVGGRTTDTPSCVGWISAEEWIQFTINVETAGKYQLSAWLAADGASGDLAAYYDGNSIGSAYCDPIGWHEYVLYPIGTVDMTDGAHIIKTEFPDGGINLESIVFTLLEAAAPATPEPAPEAAQPVSPVVDNTPAPVPVAAAVPQTGDTAIIILAITLITGIVVSRRIIKNRI